MGERECRIFEERQAKLNFINGALVHEVLGLVPYAFIEQVEDLDKRIDQQLIALREKGYLSGTITLEGLW